MEGKCCQIKKQDPAMHIHIYRECASSYSREYRGGITSINRDPIQNAESYVDGGRRIRVWNDLSFIRVHWDVLHVRATITRVRGSPLRGRIYAASR